MYDLIAETEVRKRLAGISHTTLWRLRRTENFPQPISISPNRKGWREIDVDEWLRTRAQMIAA